MSEPCSTLMQNYQPLPVSFVRGEGAWLFDEQGKAYLDAICGLAVTGLGHAHPQVSAAIARQAGQLVHVSNLYQIPQQQQLARQLCDLTGMDRAFFCNSGAEANEAAIKLARLAGHKRNIQTPRIIVMEGAFHGRTLATLSATDHRKMRDDFTPLLPGFVRAPYADLQAMQALGDQHPDIVAVLAEPVQGENGVRVPPDDFLPGLRVLCERYGWLMILDEVQTGCGRTGHFLACQQHRDLRPDLVTLAKGLANGVPAGACLARGAVGELFQPGSHGSTFGGNPLASAAALATLAVIQEENLCARAGALGQSMRRKLEQTLAGNNRVREIRNLGLMIGIELQDDAPELPAQALQEGLLVNVAAGKVVRLLPPLILTDADADAIVHKLGKILNTS